MISGVQTIFLDFDGTLHETGRIYLPSFRKAYQSLTEKGLAPPRSFSDSEIEHWLGYNAKDMWDIFMPELPASDKAWASNLIKEEMLLLLRQGRGKLYDGVPEALQELRSRGFHLVFFSNCRESYKDLVREIYALDNYFTDYIISEDYDFLPKYKIFRKVERKYPRKILVVGDRIHDMEAGFLNDVPTVACRYGYGLEAEFINATAVIDNIGQLPKILTT